MNIKHSTFLCDVIEDKPSGVRVALINQANEIFFLYNKKLQTMTFPGGWIEKDETPKEAAKRELKEELGIDISINSLKIAGYINIKRTKFAGVVVILVAHIWKGEIINCEPEKHSNLHWFSGIDFSDMDPVIKPIFYRLKMTKRISPITYEIKVDI